ncbi:MAG: SprB repeat-containing protein, partial [Bacteroidetes bacterium]|nr:SprB repeat-containing protein [Bacteroidota bacterium]
MSSQSIKTPSILGSVLIPASYGSNDGVFEIKASFDCPPYSYDWTKNNVYQSGQHLSTLGGLEEGDIICVTITSSCNITKTCCFTFDSNLNQRSIQDSISIVNSMGLCYGDTGSVMVTLLGNAGPYNYSWNTGATTQTLVNKAGTYYYSIADSICPIYHGTAKIEEPFPIIFDKTVNNVCQSGSNGSITINTLGGTGSYSFLWNTGSTTESLTNLGIGIYTLTITDSVGCYFST